jgi:hypothetical protein
VKEIIWLTVNRVQVVKMTKNPPDLKRGEIPVKLLVEVDEKAFAASVLEQHVRIADWREGLVFADPELREAVITEAEAEMIRQQRIAAMCAALEDRGYVVTEPPGNDDE